MNRRRAPSREILSAVDGPEEADQVAEIAGRLLREIELEEGQSVERLSQSSIRRYADLLLSTANAQARRDLPGVDESYTRALLADLRKSAAG